MTPRATYRLQFRKEFTFADACSLVPCFAELGVSHLYASPITTARPGSSHGYDVIDPTRINPELGGEEEFRRLAAELKSRDVGIILDIVPNHMAVGGSDNRWWLDVLEKGEASPHAGMFDIDWAPPDAALRGKVLVPFLGTPYAEALANGDIALDFEPELGRLSVLAHSQHRLPIRPEDYPGLLREAGEPLSDHAEAFAEAPFESARQRLAGTDRAQFKKLFDLYDSRREDGRARLHTLLERQHYRLAWWRVAGDELNWRRFFEITELAGVRVEDGVVFDLVHALSLRLYSEGLIDGLRVDHVDGLADPGGYCRKLRARLEEAARSRPAAASPGPAYLIVEKILASGERLDPDWHVDGTTGYEFMEDFAALLHSPAGEAPLTEYWTELSGRPAAFAEEVRAARSEILTRSFSGQFEATVRAFHRLARSSLATRDITAGALRRVLYELLVAFPAYRTYANGNAAPSDRWLVETAVRSASERVAAYEVPVLQQIEHWLLDADSSDAKREALRRFQQLSAPLAAKAVEDTAFYRYGRLLSRNDVGFDPGRWSLPIAEFFEIVADRAESFPHNMVATATHDHKRGEDARARLAVISELPELWLDNVRHWFRLNRSDANGIHPADEYQLYQTLVGAWLLMLAPDDDAGLSDFGERIIGWQEKSLREAKLRSSWIVPDTAYETLCADFVRRCLDPARSSAFLRHLSAFVEKIAPAGALNSLAQTMLHLTVPGVPDFFQGREFWDFSLVDPDNRRPVDFEARRAALRQDPSLPTLLGSWRDGRIKQALIKTVLSFRAEMPALFAEGSFEPIGVNGLRGGNVAAFIRRHGDGAIFVAVTLRSAEADMDSRLPLPAAEWWGDTDIVLPAEFAGRHRRDVLLDQTVPAEMSRAGELFRNLPVALHRFEV